MKPKQLAPAVLLRSILGFLFSVYSPGNTNSRHDDVTHADWDKMRDLKGYLHRIVRIGGVVYILSDALGDELVSLIDNFHENDLSLKADIYAFLMKLQARLGVTLIMQELLEFSSFLIRA